MLVKAKQNQGFQKHIFLHILIVKLNGSLCNINNNTLIYYSVVYSVRLIDVENQQVNRQRGSVLKMQTYIQVKYHDKQLFYIKE